MFACVRVDPSWNRTRIPTYLHICYRMRLIRVRTSSVGHTLPHAQPHAPHTRTHLICRSYVTACTHALLDAHTSYLRIRYRMRLCVSIRSICQHTSAYLRIRYRMRLRMHILTCRIRLQCGNMNPIWNDMAKCPKGWPVQKYKYFRSCWYKSTNTGAASGTKVQILTHLRYAQAAGQTASSLWSKKVAALPCTNHCSRACSWRIPN